MRDSQSFSGLTVGDNRILEMHGLGHVGPLRKCIWAPNQEMSILSQTHYQRWFPNTVFVQYCNKAYIFRVDFPAANLQLLLGELSNSGRKIASFMCTKVATSDKATSSYMIEQTGQDLLRLDLI